MPCRVGLCHVMSCRVRLPAASAPIAFCKTSAASIHSQICGPLRLPRFRPLSLRFVGGEFGNVEICLCARFFFWRSDFQPAQAFEKLRVLC